MRRSLIVPVVFAAMAALGLGAAPPEKPKAKPKPEETPVEVRSVEGTTWTGTDSDGDYYEYTFLKGGQLRYKTNTQREEVTTFEDKGDIWAQNGNTVVIAINSYSTLVATIEGDKMTGKAWNVKEKRWTWTAKERKVKKDE